MKRIIIYCLLAIIFGCASTEDVIAEFDENIDFDAYHTFVLCVDDLFVENTSYPNYDNNYVRDLIGEAVEMNMIIRGHRTNIPNPELQVGFRLIIEEKLGTIYNCDFNEEFRYWEECTLDTIQYTSETIVIYASDILKDQIIWQASIGCNLNKRKGKLREYVYELVEKLFETYPIPINSRL